MNSSARLTLVILLICVLGTALLIDGRKGDEPVRKIPQLSATTKKNQVASPEGVLRTFARTTRRQPPKVIRVRPGPEGDLEVRERHAPVMKGNDAPRKLGSATKRDAGSYTVAENDNFWSISKKYYKSHRYVRLIKKANPRVASQRYLRVGQKLIMPAVDGGAPDRTGVATRTPSRKTTKRTTSTQSGYYTVRAGDNLWTIARLRLGSGAKHWMILEANRSRIANPDRLIVGTRLVIPRAR